MPRELSRKNPYTGPDDVMICAKSLRQWLGTKLSTAKSDKPIQSIEMEVAYGLCCTVSMCAHSLLVSYISPLNLLYVAFSNVLGCDSFYAFAMWLRYVNKYNQ